MTSLKVRFRSVSHSFKSHLKASGLESGRLSWMYFRAVCATGITKVFLKGNTSRFDIGWWRMERDFPYPGMRLFAKGRVHSEPDVVNRLVAP